MKFYTGFARLVPTAVVENLRWRAKVHKLVLDNSENAELFREICAKDPIFFINGFLWTHDPRQEPFARLPFILYDFQEELVFEILKAANDHDLLIEKSRTMGVSWVSLAVFVWIWLFTNERSILLGSRNNDLVDKPGDPKALMWRVEYLVNLLPVWMKPKGYDSSKHRIQKHIENPETGCVIDAEATTENFGTGDRRFLVFLDEFSKVPNGDSMLASTQPVTNSRIINSTPFGINNAFYDLTHHSRIVKIRLHWTRHPTYRRGLYKKEAGPNGKYIRIDTDYWSAVEDADERMATCDAMIVERGVPLPPDKERSPWYAEQCARAKSAAHVAQELDINYLGSGGQWFDPAKVQETITKYARPPLLIGDLEYDSQTGEPVRFRENTRGRLQLWFLLDKSGKPSSEHRSALGCDISSGTGASNSTGCGWDKITCEKLCEYANPRIRPEEFALQMVALGKWLGNSQLIWEARGPGLNFGAKVVELDYGNIYLRKNDVSVTGKVSDIPGWAPGKDSKSLLLGNYRDIIETSECVNCSKEALEECLEYVYGPDGTPLHSKSINKDDPSGAKDNHGDRVIGDALAWKLMTYTSRNPQETKPEIPPGCLAWRNRMRERSKQPKNRELSLNWRT
jgi:hypothetical protein